MNMDSQAGWTLLCHAMQHLYHVLPFKTFCTHMLYGIRMVGLIRHDVSMFVLQDTWETRRWENKEVVEVHHCWRAHAFWHILLCLAAFGIAGAARAMPDSDISST